MFSINPLSIFIVIGRLLSRLSIGNPTNFRELRYYGQQE